MARVFEFFLDGLVAVELSIDDDVNTLILVCDWLIAGGEVDDAEARVPERNFSVTRDPLPPAVGPTMIEASRSLLDYFRRDGIASGKKRNDSAHILCA